MNWITVVVFIVGTVLYAVYGAEDLWRTFAMKRLARKLGFTYLRQRLPEALSLYGTPFTRRRFTWHVIDGERNRKRVVVFDCQVGEGMGNWRQTVIAVRTGYGDFSAMRFTPEMAVENSGGWSIFYYPEATKRGLTPVKEVRAHLESL